jgi:ABC-2 type transport system permease protein
MGSLGWRIAPIFFLSVRQFIGGKAVRAVIALGMIPVMFALVYRVDPSVDRPRRFLDDIVTELMMATVLPLATLILATSTFGDELDDRTLPYLVLKPISRLRIVIEKLLAAICVSIPAIAIGGLVSWFLVFTDTSGDNTDMLWGVLAATAIGVLIYSAVFQLLSLLIGRAILAAIVYAVIWESVLTRFIPGARYLSIRHLVNSVYTTVIDDRRLGVDDAFGLSGALWSAGAICGIAILLSTWRLRKINIE